MGVTSYYVSQTNTTSNATSCEGPRAQLSVTINALPGAPVVSPVSYCQNATASALSATGTGLLWYSAASGGTGSATAPTPSTATVGVTSYYVSQTNATSCEGPRAQLSVTINNCITAHIYPTQTTCCNYQSGGTAQLLKGCLTLATTSSKTTVSNAIPGVFFYYGSYTASTSGLTTLVVQQSVAPSSVSKLFSVQNTSNIRLTTSNCQPVAGAITYKIVAGTANIQFVAVAGQTYVVSVKYDMKSIIGATVPSTLNGGTVATYTFSMTVALGSPVGAATLVAGSTGQLPLVNGCSDNTPPASGSCPVARVASSDKSTASGSAETNNLLTDVYPNPTSSDATITFSVAKTGYVVLDVYNAIGMKVATLYNGEAMAGQTYSAILRGADLAIGTYFYRIITDGETRTTRFLIMK